MDELLHYQLNTLYLLVYTTLHTKRSDYENHEE